MFLFLALPCLLEVAAVLISSSVADLRAQPLAPVSPLKYWTDPNQLSQLLYMEPVNVKQVKGGWTQVEAIQQPMQYNGVWGGYVGWVRNQDLTSGDPPSSSLAVISQWADVYGRKCDRAGCLSGDVIMSLSFGSWLEAVGSCEFGWQQVTTATNAPGWIRCTSVSPFIPSLEDVRAMLPARVGVILGFPYLWGGRSALSFQLLDKGIQLTGVDCSGLVSLFYRSCGWILPRDASKQAILTQNVSLAELQVGDLFFFGIPNSTVSPVGHVMMLYSLTPEPSLVESATNSSRILEVADKFGVPFNDLRWGEPLKGGMSPGSILTWGAVTKAALSNI